MSYKAVVLLCLALPWFASAQELKPEEIYQKLLPSVMTLQVENGAGEKFVGTAFLALKDGVAVTAWHVVSDATKISAKFSDNQPVDVCGIIDKDEKHDLALLQVEVTGEPQVQLCPSNPPVGARAYVIGAPKGFDFSITDGLISQIQQVDGFPQYQVSCPISGGCSGGPVINERGEVVGVTSWTKKDAQNLSFATPVSFLAGLNPDLPVMPKNEMENLPLVNTAVRAGEESANPTRTSESVKPDNSVSDLKRLLKKSVGHEITLVILDHGEEKKFTIIVPKGLVR